MDPGSRRDDRYGNLLQAAVGLGSPEERRSYLEIACKGEPALIEDILHTVTMLDATESAAPIGTPRALVGRTIADRFQILRQLGEGGMAVVYEAIDTKLGEPRALKFPKAGHSQAMPPEARNAMRVTHDNICRIHEIHTAITEEGPADFISMELVEGETLHTRWHREALAPAEAIDVARQLCRGLEAAHNTDILHRDLKSNNVMLTRHNDGSLRVVITDFGLARHTVGGEHSISLSVSGTPNYIAPERWKGSAATRASDLYALGVIFYEMLTGRVPFPRETDWHTRLCELPAPPSQSARAPDPRWDRIVLRLLDPNPAKRFSSSNQVLEAIDKEFGISHRKQWFAAAAVAIVTLSIVIWYRDIIWPPRPLARLAILPFTGSAGTSVADAAVKGGLYDLAGRLESLGAKSERLMVIPIEDSVRYEVDSPAVATAKLGATHVLSGAVRQESDGVSVQASVTDARSGDIVREFSGKFRDSDMAALSTSLTGVITSAFHMAKAPPASILPAAYPHYAAGLASLRTAPPSVDSAIASLREGLKLDQTSPLLYGAIGDAYVRKYQASKEGKWLQEASMAARRAESLQPDSPAVITVLAAIESAEGRPERALAHLRRASELEPKNPDVWRRMGLALQQMGRDSEAVAAARRAVQLAPDYYATHTALGFIHFRAGRYSEAADEYRSATQIAPGQADVHSYLGGILVTAGKEADGEAALRQSLKLRETRAALNNLGVLLRYQGRNSEAVEVLQRAVRLSPDDSGLRLNLANALRKIGKPASAREHFEHASNLARAALLRDPRDAASRARLAYSMVQLGRPALAGDEALQAARLTPNDYSVVFWSIMTLESLGRRDDALLLLHNSPVQRLRDLSRQPDLVELSRDPRFRALLRQGQLSNQ